MKNYSEQYPTEVNDIYISDENFHWLAESSTDDRSIDRSINQVNTASTTSSLPDRSSWNRTRTYAPDLRLASVHLLSSQRSTWLRPLDRNEAACLQKGYKPIRVVYTEQPLTARILVDGSKVRLSIAHRTAPSSPYVSHC